MCKEKSKKGRSLVTITSHRVGAYQNHTSRSFWTFVDLEIHFRCDNWGPLLKDKPVLF